MITRLLHLCGLYLGPEDDLMPPHARDNPAGYWENQRFAELNDTLLETLGGSWNHPPAVAQAWWKQPSLETLRQRARTLIADFEDHACWGWKDPRNCLTLPFWLDLIPDLKVVLCLRNPLEVVLSLSRGEETRLLSSQDSLALWQTYHERILGTLQPAAFITTHYASYFYDSQAELQRVLNALDLKVPEEAILQARATIQPGLRHMIYVGQQLPADGVPRRVAQRYMMLCTQSGPVYQRMLADDAHRSASIAAYSQKQYALLVAEADRAIRALKEGESLREAHDRLQQSVDRLEAERATLETERLTLAVAAGRFQGQQTALAETIRRLEEQRTAMEAERATLAEKVGRLEADFATLKNEHRHVVATASDLSTENNKLQAQRNHLLRERETVQRSLLARTAFRLQGLRRNGLKHLLKKAMAFAQPASPLRVFVDHPSPNSVFSVSEPLYVCGWAFSTAGPLAHVEAFLGEERLGTLEHNLNRPDVAALFPHEVHAGKSGYEQVLAVTAVRPGAYTLVVAVTDTTGTRRSVHRPLVLTPPIADSAPASAEEPEEALMLPEETEVNDDPPGSTLRGIRLRKRLRSEASIGVGDPEKNQKMTTRFQVDRATWHDNYLNVEAWILWPDSHPPRRVHLWRGEQLLAEAPCNLSRPEISGHFPDDLKPYCRGFRLSQPLSPAPYAGQNGQEIAFTLEVVDKQGEKLRQDLALRYEGAIHSHVGRGIEQCLRAFIIDYQTRTGRQPCILNWNTGLHLEQLFPRIAIFSPPLPNQHPCLPYIEHSIDVVFCPSNDPAFVAEAHRVASGAVLTLEAPEADASTSPVRITWHAGIKTQGVMPATTIIIPVYNHAAFTEKCLEQLKKTLPDTFCGEVIVVDDHSTDETPHLLARMADDWPVLRIIRNEKNLGFINNCNKAAEAATGEFLLFLNNDTLPQPGWFLALLNTFQQYPDAGAVGGKLIYPDGTLQEAGGLLFSDGSGWNFGRNDPATDHPLYNHVRAVDYCSGALLATRRALFRALGGFDTQYQPAYYEDADYCFKVRRQGLTVYYQPESVVIHFEGISSGTEVTASVKRYQVVNREKFVDTWRDVLQHHPPPPPDTDLKTRHRLVVQRYAY